MEKLITNYIFFFFFFYIVNESFFADRAAKGSNIQGFVACETVEAHESSRGRRFKRGTRIH